MKNLKLIEYVNKLTKRLKEVEESIKSDEINDFQKAQLSFEKSSILNVKLAHVFNMMVEKMPKEFIEGLVKKILGGEEGYKKHISKITYNRLPVPPIEDVIKTIPYMTILEKYEQLIDEVEEHLDDKTIDEIIDNEANYIPPDIDNTPNHPFKGIVEKSKQSDKFKSLDSKTKEKVSKLLDEINEVVTSSPSHFTGSQSGFDRDYESARNKKTDKFLKDCIEDNNSMAKEVFTYKDWVMDQREDVTDNQEKIDYIKSIKFKLDEDSKKKILKVWKKMDELNIVDAGNGGEQGDKIYGFKKLLEARSELSKAIKNNNFDNLENLKNEYNRQLENVREMYKMVKEELNPAPEKMPGNLENIRNDDIPAEFKNDLPLNASFNGAYNAYSLVKNMGLTAEEFLNNLDKYINKSLDEPLRGLEIDNYYKNESFERKISLAYGDTTEKGYNTHGVPRMLGLLNLFVDDKNLKMNNEFALAVTNGKIQLAGLNDLFTFKYFAKDRTGTLTNVLLARPEDRDLMKLRPYDGKTLDRLHSVKAFDRAKYIKEKNILPNEFADRITTFVAEAYKISEEDNARYRMELAEYEIANDKFKSGKGPMPIPPEKQKFTKEMFVREIKDVQVAIQQYLLLKNPLENDGVERLKNILKDPITAFESMNICPEYKNAMAGLKNKNKTFEKSKKDAQKLGDQVIKNTRTAEKNYNRRIDAILKSTNTLSAKLKGETDSKKVSDIQVELAKKMNEMKTIQQQETERLKAEYKAGKLPKNYCEERIANIIALKHNEKVALFDDGFDKEKYIKSTGLDGLTKAEKEGLCKSEYERRKVEREELYNKLYLIQKGSILNSEVGDIKVNASFQTVNVEEVKTVQEPVQQVQKEQIIVGEAEIAVDLNKSIESSKSDISVSQLDEKEKDSISISSK